MPLYSSKNIANKNDGTRKKPNKVHIFLTNSKKFHNKTLVTKQFSSLKQEKEPPRVAHHFTSFKQDINHITREINSEFSQEGCKFQPSRPLTMGEL
jgi:hypothetical protein